MAAAVGAIAGGIIASEGAEDAAETQASAANQASQTQLAMFNQTREDMAPWRVVGENALGRLAELYGIAGPGSGAVPEGTALVDVSSGVPTYNEALYATNADYRNAWNQVALEHFGKYGENYMSKSDPAWIENEVRARLGPDFFGGDASAEAPSTPDYSAFYQSPGYQFRLNQGIQALDRSAAARGRLNSGAQSKALMRFGQGLASQEFGNYTNRLAGLAGVGQTATNTLANLGAHTAANVGNTQMRAGNARAAGYINQANVLGSTLGDLAYTFGNSNLFDGGGYVSPTLAGSSGRIGGLSMGSFGFQGV